MSRNPFLKVLISLPAISQSIDIELRRSDKITSLPQMAFHYCNRVMQGEAHCNGEEGDEHNNVLNKSLSSFPIGLPVHEPVTDKKDKSADHEKTHDYEIGF